MTTPINMVTAMVPSSSRVVAAFLLFGFRNAGTPLEMASTPVNAAEPEEKARASSATMAKPVKAAYFGSASIPYWALCACTLVAEHQDPEQPVHDHADDAHHEAVDRDGEHGAGLAHPTEVQRHQDQRGERAAYQASCPSMKGNTDFAFCTPEEIDTATVST